MPFAEIQDISDTGNSFHSGMTAILSPVPAWFRRFPDLRRYGKAEARTRRFSERESPTPDSSAGWWNTRSKHRLQVAVEVVLTPQAPLGKRLAAGDRKSRNKTAKPASDTMPPTLQLLGSYRYSISPTPAGTRTAGIKFMKGLTSAASPFTRHATRAIPARYGRTNQTPGHSAGR